MNTHRQGSTSTLRTMEMNRRRLLQIVGTAAGATALGASAPSGAVLASRLTAQDDGTELIVAVQEVPEQLDPPQNISNVGGRVLYSMFDHLIATDFAGGNPPGTGFELKPMLATEWSRIDDLTLELKLREGVLFHNGDPFTADDVKFTFDRMIGDDFAEELTSANLMVSTISEVEVVDDLTVRIITAKPDPDLEKRIAAIPCYILPKAHFEAVGLEAFAQSPVGTGPFSFEELRADDQLALNAFNDYWGGPPPVSKLTFRVIPEVSTRVTAVVSDEVQIITNVPPDQVPTLESTDGIHVEKIPLANFHVLLFNTHNPVLADKALRQALTLGIDRQLLVDTLWGGNAFLTRGLQVESWGDMYNPERPFLEYNPDKAKELIASSNYNGETITYTTKPGYYTFGDEAGQAIVAMWQDIGINAEFVGREDSFSAPMEEIMVRTWSNGTFPYGPDGAFWRIWGEGATPQRSFWTPENPRFNELGYAARETLDHDFRYDAYQEMLDIWEEEAPGTVLYNPIENYPVRDGIQWQPYSYWYMDFRADNLTIE